MAPNSTITSDITLASTGRSTHDLGDLHEGPPVPALALPVRGHGARGLARGAHALPFLHLVDARRDHHVARREALRDLDASLLADPDLDRRAVRAGLAVDLPDEGALEVVDERRVGHQQRVVAARDLRLDLGEQARTQPPARVRHPRLHEDAPALGLEGGRHEVDLAREALVGIGRHLDLHRDPRLDRGDRLLGQVEQQLEPVDRVDLRHVALAGHAVAGRDPERAHQPVEGRADPRPLELHLGELDARLRHPELRGRALELGRRRDVLAHQRGGAPVGRLGEGEGGPRLGERRRAAGRRAA